MARKLNPPPPRASTIEPGGSRHGLIDDRVVLEFDARFRRRIVMRSEGGLEFLLDLERATVLRHGDVARLDDGRRIAIVAALEPLAEITAQADDLARIAWHLGNRHLPIMFRHGTIWIRRDHVIEEMARGLGAIVHHVDAAFDPEGGAYAPGGGHSHAHGQSHD